MINRLFKLLFLCIALTASHLLIAQEEALFTQYQSNRFYFNPAFAGTHDGINLVAVARQQFVTLDRSPNTQLFSLDLPVGGEHIGLGVVAYNDEIGFVRRPTVNLAFAYKIYFNSGILSLAVQGGATFYSTAYSNTNLKVASDPAFDKDLNLTVPRAGVGFMYESKKFYLGISSPSLITYNYDQSGNNRYTIHSYFMGGVTFDINRDVTIEPSTNIRYVAGTPIQADITTTFGFLQRAFIGVTYRTSNQFAFIGRFNFSRNLALGYSYDLGNSALSADTGTFSNGSHEILLNYNISFKRNKFVSPRQF